MKKKALLASLLICLFYISSCYKDNLAELTAAAGYTVSTCDSSGVISYAAQVVPVLQNNCGTNNSCHSSANTSGYDLSSYAGVNSVALNGDLINAISWTGTVPQMPQNGSQLDDCNLTIIKKWVAAGHLNN